LAYEVRLKPSAERELRKLPRQIQLRVARRLDGLTSDPRPHGCEKLAGLDDLYRIRVGEYRIVYQVSDQVLLILVVTIGHRGDVYRRI
jgi:mRNA interferase RelE/StbE